MMKQFFFKKNKKGTVAAEFILFFLLFLLMFGIFIFFLTYFFITFTDQLQLTGTCTTGVCNETLQDFIKSFYLWDKGIFLFVMASIIGVAWASLRANTRSIMFLFLFVESALLGYVGYFFSSFYGTFVSQPEFLAIQLIFPVTIVLLTNSHWISLALMIIASFSFFTRQSEGGIQTLR